MDIAQMTVTASVEASRSGHKNGPHKEGRYAKRREAPAGL